MNMQGRGRVRGSGRGTACHQSKSAQNQNVTGMVLEEGAGSPGAAAKSNPLTAFVFRSGRGINPRIFSKRTLSEAGGNDRILSGAAIFLILLKREDFFI